MAPARLDAVDDDVAEVAVAGDLDRERGRKAAARRREPQHALVDRRVDAEPRKVVGLEARLADRDEARVARRVELGPERAEVEPLQPRLDELEVLARLGARAA